MTKPPSPPLSGLRQLQKSALQFVDKASDTAGESVRKVARRLREFDEAHSVTDTAAKAGKRIQDAAIEVDGRYDISGKATRAYRTTADGLASTAATIQQAAAEHGVTDALRDQVINPLKQASQSAASSEMVLRTREAAEGAYGSTRRVVKEVFAPNFATYDSYELLEATKRELNYIASCLLQISRAESSRIGVQFGRAVTAKIAGAASTSALLTIVAAFGHAGTGAAISGLSGAAATSATMAWVGSLVGGGVAAGAALSGSLAIVVGLAAYRMVSSERRDFDSMTSLEQRIVQSCWMLASVADAYQKRPAEFTPGAATELLEKALIPLQRDIESNLATLCGPLDGKHSVAMRQHVLVDFHSAVVNRFSIYLGWAHSEEGGAWHAARAAAAKATNDGTKETGDVADMLRVLSAGNAEAAIGGVFAALLTRTPLDDSTESRLVLEALRRSSTSLNDASESELGDYLRSVSPDGWKGMASNVKGIYHELQYVEQYNAEHEDTFARLYVATNHPGADVQICDADSGDVLQEVQLKAVGSTAAVQEHLQRYPDIEVAATDEVAIQIEDARVASSGLSNDALHENSYTRLGELRDHTIATRTSDTALVALGIASTAELVQMLRGERAFPEAVLNTAAKVGTAAGATALTAFLFS